MMERNRKLRLLVTTDCPNHCPLCCNNSWDFSKLPSVTSFDYDEVMITGGEPLLFVDKVVKLARSIKNLSPILYPEEDAPKIYVYTSIAAYFPIRQLLNVVDGIVLTPHSKDDVKRFIRLNERLRMYLAENPQLKSSLRLNLFKNIKDMLPEDIDLSIWKVMRPEIVFFICMLLFLSSIGLVVATFACGYLIGRYTEIDILKEIQEGK